MSCRPSAGDTPPCNRSWLRHCKGDERGNPSPRAERVLLGAAEAGLFPGVMLYLTYWFGREERARAIGYFLLGVCIANILSGPVGGALLQMDGFLGWHGWQWMFVIEGLPAVALAWVVWKKLPDGPASAPWLTAAESREVLQRLQAEQDQQASAGQVGHSLRDCLRDRQIWLAILVYFCHQISIYTVIFFLPGIIGTYGQLSPLQIGTLNSVPWIAAAIGAAWLPRFATHPQRCRRMLLAGLGTMAAGLLLAALAGVLPPRGPIRLEGEIWLDERLLTPLPPQARHIGMLFQDDLLFDHLTVAENLMFGMPATIKGKRARREKALTALTQVALADQAARLCDDHAKHGDRDRILVDRQRNRCAGGLIDIVDKAGL